MYLPCLIRPRSWCRWPKFMRRRPQSGRFAHEWKRCRNVTCGHRRLDGFAWCNRDPSYRGPDRVDTRSGGVVGRPRENQSDSIWPPRQIMTAGPSGLSGCCIMRGVQSTSRGTEGNTSNEPLFSCATILWVSGKGGTATDSAVPSANTNETVFPSSEIRTVALRSTEIFWAVPSMCRTARVRIPACCIPA